MTVTRPHGQIVPPDREPTLLQWKVISEQALRKLPDHVCPWDNDVFDTRTKCPISESSLMTDYGLSKREARSLFLTL
jgi:hypothetical protein